MKEGAPKDPDTSLDGFLDQFIMSMLKLCSSFSTFLSAVALDSHSFLLLKKLAGRQVSCLVQVLLEQGFLGNVVVSAFCGGVGQKLSL